MSNEITFDTAVHKYIPFGEDNADVAHLQRARSDLTSLYHTSQILGTILDSEQVFLKALELILKEMPAVDCCSIHVLDEKNGELRCKADLARNPRMNRKYTFSRTMLDCVLRERKAVLAFDAQGDDRFDGSLSIVSMQIRAAMCVPLNSHNRLIGVIQACNLSPRNKICENDLKLLSAIGNQVGIAVENALLYERLDREKEMLNEAHEKLKIAQESLVQSEKLAAVGQLTAGIIHDVKNPLLVIKGHANIIEELLTEAEIKEISGFNLLESVNAIDHGVKHCSEIVNQLLQFARQSPPDKESVCPNELVRKILSFLKFEFSKHATKLETNFTEVPPEIRVDVNQIKQTLINIIINALQAMDHGGKLEINTALSKDGENTLVNISITDNGSGMPEEVMNKIFDPFFTTKKATNEGAGGTGLGLSTCYGIIQNHGGSIKVDSKLGEGTTFHVNIPASE